MNVTEAVFEIIGGCAAALTIAATYTRWIYRRGQDSGRDMAERAGEAEKINILESKITAMQAELDSLRSRRRRT
jgi:ubiquinone biosynthesis protein UbiJ